MLESTAKFIASIIASTSPITEDGFARLKKVIEKFQIIPRGEISTKKELPVGGFELAMEFFGGLEHPKGKS